MIAIGLLLVLYVIPVDGVQRLPEISWFGMALLCPPVGHWFGLYLGELLSRFTILANLGLTQRELFGKTWPHAAAGWLLTLAPYITVCSLAPR
jgi:hypothetical protein